MGYNTRPKLVSIFSLCKSPRKSLWDETREAHDKVQKKEISDLIHHLKFEYFSVVKWLILAQVANVDHTHKEVCCNLQPQVILGKNADQSKDEAPGNEPERIEQGDDALIFLFAEDKTFVNIAILLNERGILQTIHMTCVEGSNEDGQSDEYDRRDKREDVVDNDRVVLPFPLQVSQAHKD